MFYGVIAGALVSLGSYASYKSVESIGGVKTFPLVNLSFIIPLAYGVSIRAENLDTPAILGLALAGLGVILLAEDLSRARRGWTWLLLAALGYGFTDIVISLYSSRGEGNLYALSLAINLTVTIYLIIPARHNRITQGLALSSIATGALLAISTYALAAALALGEISRVSPISKMNTVIPVAYSVFRGEELSVRRLIGVCSAITAVALLAL